MSKYEKKTNTRLVIGIGTVICLYQSEEPTIEYIVLETGLYLSESGTWVMGFTLENSKTKNVEFVPYFVFKELNDSGSMWIKGSERIAEFQREKARKAQLELAS